MNSRHLPQKYSSLQAWLYDHLIADRALNLHALLLEYTQLADFIANHADCSVLDVGCGGGQAAIHLKEQYPDLQLTGVDLSADQIARARQRAKRKGYTLQFKVADAQTLPFPDASFDVVFSFGSAKHWPNPLKGIGECWRVLKPEGELLVADATSDTTQEEVINFYRTSQFPRLLEKILAAVLYERMFRHASSMDTYEAIAAQLEMPQGTVSHMPNLPIFLFRTAKE